MAGLKMGDRLLQLGCGDGRLLAALGAKVGLTGRACAADESDEAVARAGAGALKAGVFVEVQKAPLQALPYEPDSFDLVVILVRLARMTPEQRVGCLQAAWRVLRPGGRCMAVEPAPRGGLGALTGRWGVDPHHGGLGATARALEAEGFKGVRHLAERDGVAFIEGAKPR